MQVVVVPWIRDYTLITKHDLKVRPVYHWTPRRTRAHMAIAYMAFAYVRLLAYRVKLQ